MANSRESFVVGRSPDRPTLHVNGSGDPLTTGVGRPALQREMKGNQRMRTRLSKIRPGEILRYAGFCMTALAFAGSSLAHAKDSTTARPNVLLIAIDDLNEAVLNLLPLRFAVLSWLPFPAIGADAEAVRRVLSGDIAFRSLLE